jgi:cytidine deaminase
MAVHIDTELNLACATARKNAYAPYSKYLVGAALRDEHGVIHSGCNVENAAYPEGTCAEAGAIAAMAINGARRITAISVCGAGDGLVTPCGGCRQKIREFAAPETPIHICDEQGNLKRTFTLADLLPSSFGPDHLEAAK